MIYKNEDIDERKNMLYKKMINEVSQKRDEKALKKQAAKEVDLLKKCLFITSGKHYLFFWKKLLFKIKSSLIVHRYSDDDWLAPQAINYRKIAVVYTELAKKFKLR